ncbi:hypothetical protein KUCAC02_014546, partial [Chaenocephalus aceratus]
SSTTREHCLCQRLETEVQEGHFTSKIRMKQRLKSSYCAKNGSPSRLQLFLWSLRRAPQEQLAGCRERGPSKGACSRMLGAKKCKQDPCHIQKKMPRVFVIDGKMEKQADLGGGPGGGSYSCMGPRMKALPEATQRRHPKVGSTGDTVIITAPYAAFSLSAAATQAEEIRQSETKDYLHQCLSTEGERIPKAVPGEQEWFPVDLALPCNHWASSEPVRGKRAGCLVQTHDGRLAPVTVPTAWAGHGREGGGGAWHRASATGK